MFTIETVNELRWCSDERQAFACSVKYAEFNNALPVGVGSSEKDAHLQELWARGLAGDYGAVAEYVPYADEGPQAPMQPTIPATTV